MTDHQPTIDFDRATIVKRLCAAEIWGRIAHDLVCLATAEPLLAIDDDRRVCVVRLSERALAARLGRSKSGVREALLVLENRGLISRGPGVYVLEWSRFVELPEPQPFDGLPAPSKGRSEPGRSVVGLLVPSTAEEKSHPSTPPNPTPSARASLPYTLRWHDLFEMSDVATGWRVQREGVLRLWRTCVEIGWLPDDDPDTSLSHVLALVSWLITDDRKAAGVEHPLAWLIAALKRGRDGVRSWPPVGLFEEARKRVLRAKERGLVVPGTGEASGGTQQTASVDDGVGVGG